ncbi:MAG: hypothetical protein KatS3mg110_2968 [Pirellulaceae bacterium]|nr:MAG: hypothetical protein KatS3mg110_2968 [Pirellulaceae bacterium]
MVTIEQIVPQDLLPILRCPLTHTPLSLAQQEWVTWLNTQIAQDRIRNRAGRPVTGQLLGALWNADRSSLYPVYDYAPVLIVEEAIVVEQLPEGHPPIPPASAQT